MKWASLLLGLLTLPLLFNFTPLEVLRLKTFDSFIETPEPSGNFVILNITEEDVEARGGYSFSSTR
jgi:CHASE2 domain-containing sensor protein